MFSQRLCSTAEPVSLPSSASASVGGLAHSTISCTLSCLHTPCMWVDSQAFKIVQSVWAFSGFLCICTWSSSQQGYADRLSSPFTMLSFFTIFMLNLYQISGFYWPQEGTEPLVSRVMCCSYSFTTKFFLFNDKTPWFFSCWSKLN